MKLYVVDCYGILIIVDYGMFELVYDWIWNWFICCWLLVYDYEHAEIEIEIDDYDWIELVSLWILMIMFQLIVGNQQTLEP